MSVLIGMSPEVKGKSYNLDKSPFTIGNASDNDVPVTVPGVSGHHCEVVTEGGKFILRDLGSTNGTRVNNQDVTAHTLHGGDLIAVGTVEFLFNNEGADDTGSGDAPAAEVIETSGNAEQPAGFESISPFGPRRREPTGRMTTIIIILGIVVVIVAAIAVYKMFAG